MTTTSKALSAIGIIALVAAGFYFATAKPSTPAPTPIQQIKVTPPPTAVTPVTPPEPTPPAAKTPTETEETPSPAPALPAIDDTWKTFTSKSGDFSFQWPTRGKYAPTWNQSFADSNPCTEPYPDGLTLRKIEDKIFNNISFCLIKTETPDGDLKVSHSYSTAYGKKFLIIRFDKIHPKGTWDSTVYEAHLNQIMSTFTFLK